MCACNQQVMYDVKHGKEKYVTFTSKETYDFYNEFFNNNMKFRDIKDWQDYTITKIKLVNEDDNTMYCQLNIHIYDKPLFGNGYFRTTDDSIHELSLDEFIQDMIFKIENERQYTSRKDVKNKNVKITNIEKIYK